MDPLILKYLGDKYSDEERSKVEEQAREEKNKLALLQAASGFGEALAGRAPSQSGQYFGGLRGEVDKNTIGKFDQGRKQALMDYELGNKLKEEENMNDPNAPELAAYKQFGQEIGIPPEQMQGLTKKRFNEISPMFQKVYEMKQRALREAEAKNLRASERASDRAYDLEKFNRLNSMENKKYTNLPEDKKLMIHDLAKKNAAKVSISNQIDSVMENWDKLSEDQKLAQGRTLLKTLNSAEGADAIGVEEANRLGAKLEFAMGNLFNSNSLQLGRDLEGFKEQAETTGAALKNAIKMNQKIIDESFGRIPEQKQVGKEIKQTSDTVIVIDKSGNRRRIPSINLQDAISQGAKLEGK